MNILSNKTSPESPEFGTGLFSQVSSLDGTFYSGKIWSTREHRLESFKLSESVSTLILSWKLSLLDLICSQLSENALRAKSRVFCHFWSFETLAFFTFCWFWPSRSHWRPFLDLESTIALWLSYPNQFLYLIYLYPFPCKSSGKIDSFFMAEQSK